MMNNRTQCISGNNTLKPATDQRKPIKLIRTGQDSRPWHDKSKEEKLTTILIIISILSLLLTF